LKFIIIPKNHKMRKNKFIILVSFISMLLLVYPINNQAQSQNVKTDLMTSNN